MMTNDLEALVLADAAGALDESERIALEPRLARLSGDDQQAVARIYDTVVAIARSVEAPPPPPHVRARVLAAVLRPTSSYTVTADAAWADSRVPGISTKVLAVDKARGVVTLLLRAAAGARYPAHHHSVAEECYVVRGSVAIGNLVLRAGDFHHADADSDHSEIVALEPTEVLLFAGLDDYAHA